jgi:hypothetical protein
MKGFCAVMQFGYKPSYAAAILKKLKENIRPSC